MKEHTLSQVARIGQLVQSLTVAPKSVEAADQAIDQLLGALETVDLPHTLGAAQQLQTFQREALRKYSPTQGLSNAHDLELATIANTIIKALHHEASEKNTIILDSSAIAESLRKLPERMPFLTEAQTHLRNEVIRCLECSAYRAAIVMAWNFAFDYVRHWVFSNHLAPFNNSLTTRYTIQRGGQTLPRYDAISQYPDFWEARPAPGERTVLDTCQDANILPGKAYDSLVECLRRRNDYAHPNFKTPDVDLTKGYIAELISVIMSDPFPKPSGT
jgi:hypothetical protein